MATIADLAAAVAAESGVISSAVVLLAGLKAALDEAIAANDPAAVQAVADGGVVGAGVSPDAWRERTGRN